MEAIELCQVVEGAPGIPVHFEALSSNVRQHRYCNRQCSQEERQSLGPLAGETLPAPVPRKTDARAGHAWMQAVRVDHAGVIARPWTVSSKMITMRTKLRTHENAFETERGVTIRSQALSG